MNRISIFYYHLQHCLLVLRTKCYSALTKVSILSTVNPLYIVVRSMYIVLRIRPATVAPKKLSPLTPFLFRFFFFPPLSFYVMLNSLHLKISFNSYYHRRSSRSSLVFYLLLLVLVLLFFVVLFQMGICILLLTPSLHA